eukprot:1515516-Karenia_brevis.AAC.1
MRAIQHAFPSPAPSLRAIQHVPSTDYTHYLAHYSARRMTSTDYSAPLTLPRKILFSTYPPPSVPRAIQHA